MDRLAILVVGVLLVGTFARADPAVKPWAANVSDADQALALSIFKQANADFEEARYAQALTKYREAIRHWDHPAIRFNMAVCLINLDQPLEAGDDLELALKYGEDALGSDVYTQGLTYRKLLQGQLAELEVISSQAGVVVTLDGKPVVSGPGNTTVRATPGPHQLVATKPGFLTQTLALSLGSGKVTRQEITLIALDATTKTVRRWPIWKPWTVLGAGVALGGLGAGFEALASKSYTAYNAEFQPTGVCANGCGGKGQPPLPSSGTRARIENVTAISLFALGGALIAAGVAGVFIDQPHVTFLQEHDLRVSPVVGPGTASLVIEGSL